MRGKSRHRRAVTLVEVVAALAILATVVATMLAARARHTRQYVAAGRAIEAVQVLDVLVADWWRQPGSIPVSGDGNIDSHPDLTWRAQTLGPAPAGLDEMRVVRLSILGSSGPSRREPAVLASVDLLLRDDEIKGTEVTR